VALVAAAATAEQHIVVLMTVAANFVEETPWGLVEEDEVVATIQLAV
jgi:hypothetical protein